MAEAKTVLDHWREQSESLVARLDNEHLDIRVLHDQGAILPARSVADAAPRATALQIGRDPFPYRGTGGVLRDVSCEYQLDGSFLVANAAQILLEPLVDLVEEMDAARSDVVLHTHADGTPSGLMLLKCITLQLISAIGFVDMKEQGLPLISKYYKVSVITSGRLTGVPIRTLEGYIRGLTMYHRKLQGGTDAFSPFAEDWRRAFAIVESGARVDPTSRIHNSVVFRGGHVGRGAVIARSVVGNGGVVPRGRFIMDRLVL